MRLVYRALLVVSSLACLATSAHAQSAVAGTVRDSSGAVLPGVTVEAASPVLIEKVRTSSTDGTGQYRITDLLPGTYTLSFSLSGFATVRREEIALTGSGVTTINAEMRVGNVTETLTIRGETPVVDIQTTKRQEVLTSDVVRAIPATRSYNGILAMIPSVNTSAFFNAGEQNNTQLSPSMTIFTSHGGRGNEGRVQVDGLNVGAAFNGGGVSGYIMDTAGAQELQFTLSGGLGEAETGGINLNIVPKTGGNKLSGEYFTSFAGDWSQSDNIDDKLKAFGITQNGLLKNWDLNLSVGGPFKRDKLWFYANYRDFGTHSVVPGAFGNKNAGDPTKWTYEADFSRPARNSSSGSITPTLRLTMQVSRAVQVGAFVDAGGYRLSDQPQIGVVGAAALATPETGTVGGTTRSPMFQYKGTWTVTSKLLLDASFGSYHQNWNGRERPDNNRDLIRVTEQCTTGCPNNGGLGGLVYRAQVWNADYMEPNRWQAATTYVTGAHNMKFGYQGVFHWNVQGPHGNDHNLEYRLDNGVPNQLTQTLRPYRTDSRVRYDAFYAQDQWTRGRFTWQGALRYDHAWSYYNQTQIGPTNFLPTAVVFPKSKGVLGYHDISPRLGLAYDVFGNGKTALKFNAGRYLEAAVNNNGNYSELSPFNRTPTSVTRSWVDANGNYQPDCDLMNGNTQDLRASGGDSCGRWSDLNFGKEVFSLSYDEAVLKGWYNRPSDWQIGATVQHEILPRISVEASYVRRWLQNFTVTDNRAVTPADFTEFSVTAPPDSRLPNGGGYVVGPLYNVIPSMFGVNDNYRTYSPAFGNVSMVYNGVDINIAARLRNGLQVQGGTSTGQQVIDACEIRAKLPEQVSGGASSQGGIAYSPVNPYCHDAPGMTTRATAAVTYTIPKIDVQFASTLTSSPGVPLQANWSIPNAIVRQWLGRDLAGSAPNVTVNLLAPGEMRSDRVNILDFRVGKVLRQSRHRALVAVDLYNVLNLDTVLVYNQTYVPNGSWLIPQSVLTARTAKLTVQYDF